MSLMSLKRLAFSRLKRLSLATAFFACLSSTSMSTAFAHEAQTIVQDLAMLFSAWSGQPEDCDVYKEAAKFIDYGGMAERALGKRNWDELTRAQRQEFVAAFSKLIERRYYPRWHKIFCNGKLTYLGQTRVNGDTLLKSSLKVGNNEDMVIWRLHPRNGELTVISLAVGKTDLLSKVRDRFQKRMGKKGFANLMEWLNTKVEDDSQTPPG